MIRTLVIAVGLALLAPLVPSANARAQSPGDVTMVVVLMRHGVRSPTHPDELKPYARQAWPAWEVPPGYLTPHGAMLVRQLGTYYRRTYAGLIGASGCPARDAVFVWADVDERTRATAAALLDGFAPDCGISIGHVHADSDTLFDPPIDGKVDAQESLASLTGAIGGDPNGLRDAFLPAFETLDTILGCTTTCTPLVRVPSTIDSKGDGKLASFGGGADLAAGAAENLLLEYTDGKPQPGWGRLNRERLLHVMQVYLVVKRLEHANAYTARVHASNIMSHVLDMLRGGAHRAAFIVGHDTQVAELSGLLRLSWLIHGDQMNDTPPGSALVFEVHAPPAGATQPFVRVFFAAQSLDDMRAGHGINPQRVPVYVTGCPSLDCPMDTFAAVVTAAIDPSLVVPWNP